MEEPVIFGPWNVAVDWFDERFALFLMVEDGFAVFDDFLTTTFGEPKLRL